MKPQFQYSIVYGLLNFELSERFSVGIMYVGYGEISRKKMDALKQLMNISRLIKNLENSTQKESPERIRYSNKLIQFSPLTTINLESTPQNYKWLYETYVYKKQN